MNNSHWVYMILSGSIGAIVGTLVGYTHGLRDAEEAHGSSKRSK